MTIRQSFFEATKLKNIWNRVIDWNGLTLATVQWHQYREWKVLKSGEIFENITDREYVPIAEFHTQQELWQYIKSNIN